ncbi:MAG: glycosyltransferase family 4 protein [Geobacter sp.]
MTTSLHTYPLINLLVRLGVGLGRLIGRCLPVRNRSGLFFFFPFYHTGGAEQVHVEIVNCFAQERPWVFFTKRSLDQRFWKQFTVAARCFDVGPFLKYGYPFSAGLLAGLIGSQHGARVFGCNALFYYLLLPHLPDHVRATDLLHGLGGGAERFALPVLDRLQQRVVISRGVVEELLACYRAEGVAADLDSRLTVIENRVDVPPACPEKSPAGPLQLLFVGRGSQEKRIHLLGRAARRCSFLGLPVVFTLVGDVAAWLEAGDADHCRLTGPIDDRATLEQLYRQAHLVLISSSREGFPLTVMEGMAQGCVPLCCAVGGIPEHVRHQENGWLLPADDEHAVVEGLVAAVGTLAADRQQLARLSANAYAYAGQHFSGARFCEQYQRVIKG